MENITQEVFIENSPSSVSVKGTETILFQMKNCVCKIIKDHGEKGTGFFSKIKVNKKQEELPVLITNNHVLDSKDISNKKIISFIFNENKEVRKIEIDEKRKTYTNKILDITFIEIKPNDDNIHNFLEIDEDIIEAEEKIIELNYKKHSVYLLHYPKSEDVEVSYGQILNLNQQNILHLCDSDKGSSGSPVLSLKSFKVIGVHYGGVENKYNKATFMKKPIDLFDEFHNNKKHFTIIFERRDNFFWNNKIFNSIFVENNKNNCTVFINSIEYPLESNYKNELFSGENKNQNDTKKYQLTIKEKNKITDMSYMFFNKDNFFTNIDASYIQFYEWDTSNVINMSHMFDNFNGDILDISNWDTSNVKDMSYMFSGFSGNIPDISNWDTSNVKDMRYMFRGFSGNIPDISNWDTSNINSLEFAFCECSSLKSLPDISNWNTSNVANMSGLFSNCSSLLSLPDISRWNISKVIDIHAMFNGCKSLLSLPDISKWDTSKVTDMSNLFKDCFSIKKLPNISIWKTNNVEKMDYIFAGCSSLSSLPDISNLKSLAINNSYHVFSTKEYGEMINVRFRTSYGTFLRNISVPSDTTFIELIRKLNPCELLKVDKLEYLIITKDYYLNPSNNINTKENYNKPLKELKINEGSQLIIHVS